MQRFNNETNKTMDTQTIQHLIGGGMAILVPLFIIFVVILPQAVRRMIPPFVNQSITQLKNTSLVSTIAVPDLLYNGTLITADTYRPLEVYTVVALIYFALAVISAIAVKRGQRHAQG